jgi:hypothetical protein
MMVDDGGVEWNGESRMEVPDLEDGQACDVGGADHKDDVRV